MCDRIDIIIGDLTKENLGLELEAYHELARRITVVIHNAAQVNK